MNSRSTLLALVMLLLTSASLISVQAASENQPASFPVSKVSVTKWDRLLSTSQTQTIVAGSTRVQVKRLLGQPAFALTPEVVFYSNCQPDQSVADDCRTLVITFSADKVVDLKFVNSPEAQIIARNLSQAPKTGNLVSVNTSATLPR